MAENPPADKRIRTMPVIAATVLALLGGLATALGANNAVYVLLRGYSYGLPDIEYVRPQGWMRGYYWAAAVADPCAAILLIGGAMLFIARRRLGRVVLTTGCALVIALGIFGSAVGPGLFGSSFGTLVIYLAPLGFPIAVIALAWSPSATRWCRSRPGRGMTRSQTRRSTRNTLQTNAFDAYLSIR